MIVDECSCIPKEFVIDVLILRVYPLDNVHERDPILNGENHKFKVGISNLGEEKI